MGTQQSNKYGGKCDEIRKIFTSTCTTEEIDAAEKMLWRKVQDKCFEADRSKLKSGRQCTDNRLIKLSTTIDKDDIMRVAGRIDCDENDSTSTCRESRLGDSYQ
jgi:hypothetical protein